MITITGFRAQEKTNEFFNLHITRLVYWMKQMKTGGWKVHP